MKDEKRGAINVTRSLLFSFLFGIYPTLVCSCFCHFVVDESKGTFLLSHIL